MIITAWIPSCSYSKKLKFRRAEKSRWIIRWHTVTSRGQWKISLCSKCLWKRYAWVLGTCYSLGFQSKKVQCGNVLMNPELRTMLWDYCRVSVTQLPLKRSGDVVSHHYVVQDEDEVPDDETINQMLARTEVEYEKFQVCFHIFSFTSYTYSSC